MFTAVDRVLLLREFQRGACSNCGGSEPSHELGCEWNEALSERGFTTADERSNARRALTASAPTLPPPPST
jgi:hypothetical protein